MPPSPIILIISYWLMRTPGCGAAATECTAVETPSNVSHALLPVRGSRPDSSVRCGLLFAPATVAAAAFGAIAGVLPGGGVPAGIVCGADGGGPALPSTTVASLGPLLTIGEPDAIGDWTPESVFVRCGVS